MKFLHSRSDLFRRCFAALAVFVSVLSASAPTHASWREPVRGKHAMVVADQEIASKVGVEILKKGGNAVDAAVPVGQFTACRVHVRGV